MVCANDIDDDDCNEMSMGSMCGACYSKLDDEDEVQPTKVLFRKWQGQIIAIMPEELATVNPYHCLSYQQIGQHGACSPQIIMRESKPARERDYKALKAELESIGYNVEIINRLGSIDWVETRNNKLSEVQGQ